MGQLVVSAKSDPGYNSALKRAGFSQESTVTYGSHTYTHDEVACMVEESIQRHRDEFAGMGRKAKRQYKAAVLKDVGDQFDMRVSWWTVAFGAIIVLLGGPMGFVVAVVTCLFEYFFTKDIDGEK